MENKCKWLEIKDVKRWCKWNDMNVTVDCLTCNRYDEIDKDSDIKDNKLEGYHIVHIVDGKWTLIDINE